MCMRLSRSITALAALASVAALTACGGGGGSSGPTLTGPASPKMELSASRTTVPVQQAGNYLYPDQTTLYTTRITANVRDSRGNAIPGGGQVEFALVGGVTDRGALYQTDFEDKVEVTYADGSTRDVPAAFWGLPVEVSGSSAQVLFQGHTQTGQVEIRATYAGPNGGVVEKRIPITVDSPSATGLPSNLDLWVQGTPIFVTGQNRNDQATINAYLTDPAGQLIEADSSNNLHAEIVGDNLGGAYLLGSGGQTGRSVTTSTIAGSGQISVKSGSKSGSLTILLTADRSDNNVDNGIQDPVTKETSIAILDGQTTSLSFGGPWVNAIRNNKTSVEMEEGDFIDQGVYSRSVSVVVTDRNGNPVPGETIRFGLIDSPLEEGTFPPSGVDFSPAPATPTTTSGPRFAISGSKGNPVEGDTRFNQADGVNFITAGVGYLDRLVLWPDEQKNQREMQLSRLVERTLGSSTINTKRAFPYPEVPGYVDGNNIPWVVGRAQYGNIGATAVTDENGVAQTFINYPVSRLNQPAILTAEAENGVSTHFGAYYVGVAGGTLTSSVTSVPPGATTPVVMCALDANRVPRKNTTLVAGLTNGATISGSLITGTDGCARFGLNTTGVPLGTDAFTIPFSSGDGNDETIEISVDASATVEAPVISIAGPSGGPRTVTVLVLDSNGQPVNGETVLITATATDDGNPPTASISSVSPTTATTGSSGNGQAEFDITYAGGTGDTFNVEVNVRGNISTATFPY